uniref:Uncharacterized protein n=1 Tax=Neobacillus citreus TaxID=2833578 RepID=A0A942SXI4_9BACI
MRVERGHRGLLFVESIGVIGGCRDLDHGTCLIVDIQMVGTATMAPYRSATPPGGRR